ncbi:MAG: PH domain-containing protein [Nitriliruptoraceae bacterium]
MTPEGPDRPAPRPGPPDAAARVEVAEPDDTPAAPYLDERDRRLEPSVRVVWRLRSALGLLPVVIVLVAAATLLPARFQWPLTLLLVLGAVAHVAWLPGARWRRWHWRLAVRALELDHGVLIHRREAVPYFRIQQIDITTGPLDRLLGLASLEVTTASASGSAVLPGLGRDQAPDVRRELLARSRAALTSHPDEGRDAV